MRKATLISLCALLGVATMAAADSNADQLRKATNVLNEIMQAPDNGIPSDLLSKAVCVGIVPSELKFALGFGGSYGRGVLVCREGGNGEWGAPSMFTMGGGSFGFQIGGKATDVVFIVMNADGARKLVRDSVKLGAGASVAGGPVGRDASALTDAMMAAEILSWSRSKGLFLGVSLEGATLRNDLDENEAMYGKRWTNRQIVNSGVAPPKGATGLLKELNRYSMKRG